MSGAELLLPFVKMHGCGNDYIYIALQDLAEGPALAGRILMQAPELARAISDRHFGVGSDGLMLLDFCDSCGSDVRMHMYNSDGSRAETCGNALRCVARLLWERSVERGREQRSFRIGTDVGLKAAEVFVEDGAFVAAEIVMGAPDFAPDRVPFDPGTAPDVSSGPPWSFGWTLDELPVRGHAVSMGNPHAVLFVEGDLDELDLPRLGPALEEAEFYPQKTNVEFVRVQEDGVLVQRTWERGSGETLACGSGACAVVAAAVATGRVSRGAPCRVRLRGGELEITLGDDGKVRMHGPATLVCRGSFVWREPAQRSQASAQTSSPHPSQSAGPASLRGQGNGTRC
jgi:diaminopimelate epimerase